MSDPMRAMLLQAKTENDALRSYVRECKDEIERLRAIVDRLPAADGVNKEESEIKELDDQEK